MVVNLPIAASATNPTAETHTFLNEAAYVSNNAAAPAPIISGLTPGTDRSPVEFCATRSAMKSETELAGSPMKYEFFYSVAGTVGTSNNAPAAMAACATLSPK